MHSTSPSFIAEFLRDDKAIYVSLMSPLRPAPSPSFPLLPHSPCCLCFLFFSPHLHFMLSHCASPLVIRLFVFLCLVRALVQAIFYSSHSCLLLLLLHHFLSKHLSPSLSASFLFYPFSWFTFCTSFFLLFCPSGLPFHAFLISSSLTYLSQCIPTTILLTSLFLPSNPPLSVSLKFINPSFLFIFPPHFSTSSLWTSICFSSSLCHPFNL